jgi:tetratricopeptide (TPR) repeat protein
LDLPTAELLACARAHAARAEDDAARNAYLDILRREPDHFSALNEFGTLALAGGYRTAARTAYAQAVHMHPGNKIARINLANVLRENNELAAARTEYEAALALDAGSIDAHRALSELLRDEDPARAEAHFRRSLTGRALVTQPYRGVGTAPSLLLLVAARGGNVPTGLWIDDKTFTVHALYVESAAAEMEVPPHDLLVNAIGDADLCMEALAQAEAIARRTTARQINPPARVRLSGRAENAARLGAIPGVIAPRIALLTPAELLKRTGLRFPLLLRRPGFHTGHHFLKVDDRTGLDAAVAQLAGERLFLIDYLDGRGSDGFARKYRVMFIGGIAYPVHLAISRDWKVHYFSADMARSAAHRDEERRFLDDMPGVLGSRAVQALIRIASMLRLDYAGIDFGLAPDGSVILFEANATMVVVPPPADPIWDYRRPAIDAVLVAARRLVAGYGWSRLDAGEDRHALR